MLIWSGMGEEGSWKEVGTVEQLDAFLRVVGAFHDGILKEVHWLNDDHVRADLHMLPYRFARVRMLVQRQRSAPSAVEMVFEGVYRLHLDTVAFVGDSDLGTEESSEAPGPLLVLKIEDSEIAFTRMRWRDASDWMGPEPRFGPFV